MKQILLLALTSLSVSAFALEDREYTCKSGYPDLPANTYKISHTDFASGPTKVPFVEVQRHYKGAGGAPTTAEIRGFATHSKSGNTDYLIIGQMTLEFKDGELSNCRPVDGNN